MYSRKGWGGNVDPFILTKFIKPTNLNAVDPVISLVIFEWTDKDLIGVPQPTDSNPYQVSIAQG